MRDFTQLFLYVPGIIIFLVGSGRVRTWLGMKRLGAFAETTVISSTHVTKKDRQGREIFNYYNVVVEYVEAKTGRITRKTVKSPTDYCEGQQVKLIFKGNRKGEPVLVEHEDESLFGPWTTMIGGALMILMALMQIKGEELWIMGFLAMLLIGGGISLLHTYFTLKGRGLQPVQAEITEIYTRQISKETKIIRGSKFTYYPIVTYELNGRKNIRRCNINSSDQKTFRPGDTLELYYDPKMRIVVEKGPKTSVLVWGILLLAVGAVSGVSLLTVVIPMLAA